MSVHDNVAVRQVEAEVKRQFEKWGEQNHEDGTTPDFTGLADAIKAENDKAVEAKTLTWKGILLEEVYEALAETEPDKLIEELVQVAAVAVSWIAAVRRRNAMVAPVDAEGQPYRYRAGVGKNGKPWAGFFPTNRDLPGEKAVFVPVSEEDAKVLVAEWQYEQDHYGHGLERESIVDTSLAQQQQQFQRRSA